MWPVLAHVVQRLEHRPMDQRVPGSIHTLVAGLAQQGGNQSLCPSLPSSEKVVENISSGEEQKTIKLGAGHPGGGVRAAAGGP